MRTETIAQLNAFRTLPATAVETGLLELFAPSRPVAPNILTRGEYAPLWRADAIHRAKNMAQLTTSLANIAEHPSRGWLPPEVTRQARRLSRAYDQLGVDDDAKGRVPCAALLTEITTSLVDIFGRSRRIAVSTYVEAVSLPQAVRRALVLVASELVINALKYGYPAGTGGTIAVSLCVIAGGVQLIVEDDGVGRIETYRAGHGGGLLEQLGEVLGATITRTTSRVGHGFRVVTSVPVDLAPGEQG